MPGNGLRLYCLLSVQVGAATSSTMVLFSASAATVSLASMGRLNWQYALVFAAGAMVSSYAGVKVVTRAVRATNRTSIVVLTLATVMIIGGIFVGVSGISNAVKTLSGHQAGFNHLCTS